MKLIFNSVLNFGEVRRAQLAKTILLTPRWCPWNLLRSLKVCSDAKERVWCRKQWKATAPIQSLVKLQPRYLNLQWKTCLLAEFQPWFLSLQ